MKRNTIRRTLALAIAAGLAAGLAGCGKSGGTTGPGTRRATQEDLIALFQSAIPTGAVAPTNARTGAVLSTVQVDSRTGASGLFEVEVPPGPTYAFVDAGAVSVEADGMSPVALEQRTLNYLGLDYSVYTTFVAHPGGLPLPFDGAATHRFSWTGSARYAAGAASVRSVPPPDVTAPAAGAALDTLADLTVRWSNGGTDTTVYVLAQLVSQADTTALLLSRLVRAVDLSTTFPAAGVRALRRGPAMLCVAAYRLQRPGALGPQVTALCEAVSTRPVTRP